MSGGHVRPAMPAHARLAQDAAFAMRAVSMRLRHRFAGMRRAVRSGEQKRGGKRRADQAGQDRPAKSLAPPASRQHAHYQGEHDPEKDKQEHGAIVNRRTASIFCRDA